jgi:cell division septum initiation protein DivIVA
VAGDLRALFSAIPTFRRAVRGYDRFEVDTYVQWAEDELADAARERDDLLLRFARLRADLDEARRLLAHRPAGRDSLQLSHRIGTVLAVAADQAEELRADAAAERAAAAAEADRVRTEASAEAQRILAEAAAEADRMLTEAAAQADRTVAEAERLLEEAEQTSEEARAEAEARLDKVAALRRRAEEDAERLRREAAGDAANTRSQARDEVLRMLTAAREERRRAAAKAAALREQVERDAAARRAVLEAEIGDLEERHAIATADLAEVLVAGARAAAPDLLVVGDADPRPVAVPVQREAPAPMPGEPSRGRRPAHLLLLGRRRRDA